MKDKEGEPKNMRVPSSETLEGRTEAAGEMDAAMKGFEIKSRPVGTMFAVKTKNRTYILEHREDGWYISGHPKYCPEPTKVESIGSTWGGSSIREDYIGLGMLLEFMIPNPDAPLNKSVTTTSIMEIRPVLNTPGEKAN